MTKILRIGFLSVSLQLNKKRTDMYFRDVIGQEEIKERLRQMVAEGRIPHALLFDGPEGCGSLPMALAFARYICCTGEKGTDACGKCPSCVKFNKLAHPDLHFVFPVVKKGSSKIVCDDVVKQWREFILRQPYFSYNDWTLDLSPDNKQAMIYADEGDEIIRKLSLKSYESDYKVMVVWLPEKMHPNCSNRLLKIIEEPPAKTVFILVTENAEAVLGTIYSRTQHIHFHGIDTNSLTQAMMREFPMLSEADARAYARLSKGNILRARELARNSDEDSQNLSQFIRCMRGAYTIANFSAQKKVEKQDALIDLKTWSEEMAKIGRERQKQFFAYSQRLIRENFIMNMQQPELNYLSTAESAFSSKFFPFINTRNVESFMKEFDLAERHIEQNANGRMVFFDLALKCILLFKR